MSQEIPAKKPGKVSVKKGLTKKTQIGMPVAEPIPVPIAEAASISARTTAPKPKTKAPQFKAKTVQVSVEDLIRLRAYEIYLRRGATPGNQHEDWKMAEREVREHFNQEAGA